MPWALIRQLVQFKWLSVPYPIQATDEKSLTTRVCLQQLRPWCSFVSCPRASRNLLMVPKSLNGLRVEAVLGLGPPFCSIQLLCLRTMRTPINWHSILENVYSDSRVYFPLFFLMPPGKGIHCAWCTISTNPLMPSLNFPSKSVNTFRSLVGISHFSVSNSNNRVQVRLGV